MAPNGSQTPLEGDRVSRDQHGERREESPGTVAAWENYHREREARENGDQTPRDQASEEDDAAWYRYYLEQAARTGIWEGPGGRTPRASSSREANGAEWAAYYRNGRAASQAEQQFNFGSSTPIGPDGGASVWMANEDVRALEAGEIVRRPRPQAVPIFSMARMSTPLPIFRGLRYYIHKTVPSSIFGWLRSLLIWNGAELGCARPDTAHVIILYFPNAQPNKRVEDIEPERTYIDCQNRGVWETSDLYALLARRTNPSRDRDKLSRRCIVLSEWVEQCVKSGQRLEGGDKGGWEIKVTNDRLGVEAALATDMPNSIAIEPIGGAPMISFDLHPGTVPGGLPSGEDVWEYQPEPEPQAGSSSAIDRGSIYALPPSYTHNRDASSPSSSRAGVFCRDQPLPLSFYVLSETNHRSTVQTITRLGGGVLAPIQEATFIIAPIRGKRTVDGNDDPEIQRIVSELGLGRALVSVEWVEKCIDENKLINIETYRVTSPVNIHDDKEDDDDDCVEVTSAPRQTSSQAWRLPTPEVSPPPPPLIDRKPIISSAFMPCPEPEPLGLSRKKPRKNNTTSDSRASTPASNSGFATVDPPVPIVSARHPTPVSTPPIVAPQISRSAPAGRPRWRTSPAPQPEPDIAHIPQPPSIKRRPGLPPAPGSGPVSVSGPGTRQNILEVIDLTLDDDDDDVVEKILPEQTPIPRSPTAEATQRRRGPSAALEEFEAKKLALSRLGSARESTPSLFRLTPGSRRLKQEPV